MQAIQIRVPETELQLGPLGDIQYGAAGCDVDKLVKHINYGMEHGWRFLGMGDYIDFASPGNRQRLLQAALYDTAKEAIDGAAYRFADELYEKALAPSKHHWLGLLEGHHFHETATGKTTDHYLAERLGADFLGSCALLHVYLADFPIPVRIWCSHGFGGSVQSTAGKIPHMERVGFDFEADIYLEGHIHRKFGIPLDCLKAVPGRFPRGQSVADMRVVATTKIIGFTGSFLRGWFQGSESPAGWPRGSYAEQRVLRTIPTGGLLVSVKPVKEDWGWRLDMFVSA